MTVAFLLYFSVYTRSFSSTFPTIVPLISKQRRVRSEAVNTQMFPSPLTAIASTFLPPSSVMLRIISPSDNEWIRTVPPTEADTATPIILFAATATTSLSWPRRMSWGRADNTLLGCWPVAAPSPTFHTSTVVSFDPVSTTLPPSDSPTQVTLSFDPDRDCTVENLSSCTCDAFTVSSQWCTVSTVLPPPTSATCEERSSPI
mmetsp:Transcript_25241/g.63320  ORF Transcript_25241/g.63320 Transcript_25241/m.63320 type:complete len:202 (-) Transcript_25241:1055-1660(-)